MDGGSTAINARWIIQVTLRLLRAFDILLHLMGHDLRCILTPNAMEFDRLVQAVSPTADPVYARDLEDASVAVRARALAAILGVTILCKGRQDLITSGGDVIVLTSPVGSPRR